MPDDTHDQPTPPADNPPAPDAPPRRRGKPDPNRAAEFDATDADQVAAYIEANGFDAFRTERQRQTGYKEGE